MTAAQVRDASKQTLPIVCLVSELPPPPGGMAVQAEMLTAGLRKEGHQVINVPTNALAHTSVWRKIPLLRGIMNFSRFLSRLWPACFKANVIHVFSHSYLSFFLFSFPAVVVGKIMEKPILLHYHGGAADAFLRRWFWLARLALESADIVIVPSGFLAATFARFHLRTVEVPNLLPLESLPFHAYSPLRPRLIMARHLEPDYNVACGLRAFSILRKSYSDATLTVAGDGSEKAALVALCSELGITNAVTFTGNVTNEKMKSLYSSADIYLNSSRVDNQPVSMLEAYAYGLPVVTTAVGGIPYMAKHGVDAMLAPNNDPEQLAAHLITLLQDPALCQKIIKNARQRIQAHDWTAIYSKLRTLYYGEFPS